MAELVYTVVVYDNFHYMDENECFEHGTYASAQEALIAAKRIVDAFLEDEYRPGMNATDLLDQYKSFGDDPAIKSSSGKHVDLSAWRYAERRCAEICGDGSTR